MINFAENLNKMIMAGLGGETEAPKTEVAVGFRSVYLDASGPEAEFETNVIAPLKRLLVTMEPIQEGSGDPSPENIRPITGRDSLTVVHGGGESAQEETITISLGQSVYGGTLDVIAGKLTIDRVFFELQTADSSAWGKSTTYDGSFYIARSAFAVDGIPIKASSVLLCSHAKTVRTNNEYMFGTCRCSSYLNFFLMPPGSTVAEWVAYLEEQKNAGTPVEACAYLETPITVQLTPVQISSLIGANTIWSDAGDVSVSYIYYEETEGY